MSTKNWNASIQFPTDSGFINRIVGIDVGPSNSSGNPMVTLETEVVSLNGSPEVEVGSEVVNIAGVKSKNYYTFQVMDGDKINEDKTASNKKRLTDLLNILGIDTSALNWDNLKPQLDSLNGKLIYTQMEPDIEERRKNPTHAQIEAAKAKNEKPLGDIMKNPVTGAKLVNYWPKVREIFGLASQDGSTGSY